MLQGMIKEAGGKKWRSIGKTQGGGGLGDLLGHLPPKMSQEEAAEIAAKNIGNIGQLESAEFSHAMPVVTPGTKSKPTFMRGAWELAKKHKKALLGAALVTSVPASLLAYKKFKEKS